MRTKQGARAARGRLRSSPCHSERSEAESKNFSLYADWVLSPESERRFDPFDFAQGKTFAEPDSLVSLLTINKSVS